MWWADEVDQMGRIMWKTLFIKLSAVVGETEQKQGIFKSMWAARKAAGLPSQTSEIMAQFRIIGFHRKGVSLALRDLIPTEVIPKPSIGVKGVTPLCSFYRTSGFLAAGSNCCTILLSIEVESSGLSARAVFLPK